MSKKIISLERKTFGITHFSKKLTFLEKDNLFVRFEKTAKYIWKMGYIDQVWNNSDYVEALKDCLGLPDQANLKINQVRPQKDELAALKQAFKFKTKKDFPKWTDSIFQVSYPYSKLSEIIIIDKANSSIVNHGKSAAWKKFFQKSNWFTKDKRFVVFNADLLIGYYKLKQEVQKDFPEKDDAPLLYDSLQELLHNLLIIDCRKKEYRHLFTITPFEKQFIEQSIPEGNKAVLRDYDGRIIGSSSLVDLAKLKAKVQAIAWIAKYLEDTYNVFLQKNSDQEQKEKTKAQYYQTKKNIKHQTLKEMDFLANEWIHFFKGVEIDNDVDLHLLRKLEPEISDLIKVLPRATNGAKPILRFRKLKNHGALGMYTPYNNTLAIDFRATNNGKSSGLQSFIHEYGHFLDYNSADNQLALSDGFYLILHYTQKNIRSSKAAKKISSKKYGISYLLTPSEIFARSFEIYMSSIGLNNDLISDQKTYNNSNNLQYATFDTGLRKVILQYFDDLFPDLRKRISILNRKEKGKVIQKPSIKGTADHINVTKQSNSVEHTNKLQHFQQLTLF